MGWTQHTVGVQNIRAPAILQLLLGNMGRPGGGIMAMRGHANIQGASDIPTLYNLLPGYIPMARAEHGDLKTFLESSSATAGLGGHIDAYTVSLLKAWFGDAASADNDFGFGWPPRLSGDHSTYPTVLGMKDGWVHGFFVLGKNPAVGSAHSSLHREAMANLRWLVVRDLVEIETATFWKKDPERARCEVFFLPAASHVEKEGTFTNTQRMLQWREKAVDPPGECSSDLWFVYELGRRIRERLRGSTETRDRAILSLTWDYPLDEHEKPSAEEILKEINGRGPDGTPVAGFGELRPDGSTACGCWVYAGCFAGGVNQSARHKPGSAQSWGAPEWGWAWPANRRVLYNRASADPAGKPWSERKRYTSGGTRRRDRGPATTYPTSLSPNRPAMCRHPGVPPPRRRSPAMRHSSCSPTAGAGSSHRWASSTGRCRRTTSHTNRHSTTPSTQRDTARCARLSIGRTIPTTTVTPSRLC